MTTAVSGLIKIGQTGTSNFQERMRFLEANGYYNVSGLKRFFAIELDDYTDKESLLIEIFNKHRVGDSELFALDYDLVRQLLLSFDGVVIYPKDINKEKEFDEVSKARELRPRSSRLATRSSPRWWARCIFSPSLAPRLSSRSATRSARVRPCC